MRISKIGFVLQTIKKVFSVENGFSKVVTKKCFVVGSKRVLHIKGVSDRTIAMGLWGLGFGLGSGLGFQLLISTQGSKK